MKTKFSWYLMIAAVAVTAASILYVVVPRGDRADGWHWQAFGKIPVQHDGRVKPIDTLARVSLASMSRKQTYNNIDDPEEFGLAKAATPQGKSQPAVQWMLDVLTASQRPFRNRADEHTKNPLPEELGGNEKGTIRVTQKELEGLVEKAQEHLELARASTNPELRKEIPDLEKYVEVGNMAVKVYRFIPNLDQKVIYIVDEELRDACQLPARPGFRYSYRELRPSLGRLIGVAQEGNKKDSHKRTELEKKALELFPNLKRFEQLTADNLPLIPPEDQTKLWVRPQQAEGSQLPGLFQEILNAYTVGDKDAFNAKVDQYLSAIRELRPADMKTIGLESYLSNSAPFFWGLPLYVFVFLLAAGSWLGFAFPKSGLFEGLNRGAYWSLVGVFVLHTFGLLLRMYLQGRPPVTNLYASAIFIGWGCVGLCLILEAIPFFRYSIALAAGSILGFSTLFIAYYLGLDSDTIDKLQAVLDTQLWLWTHVTCITIGYTTMFVAGLLGVGYILTGVFTTALNREGLKLFSKVIYGVICFAMFLSFVGTVLGGIWADQSWGRFWGWDPKENGALLIVIWVSIILHARWAGMIRERGLAVLAVFGNVVTAWSWFGTNLLGVGLHSYGFMAGAFFWLIGFGVSQLLIMGIGCLPLELWRGLQPGRETMLRKPSGRGQLEPVSS